MNIPYRFFCLVLLTASLGSGLARADFETVKTTTFDDRDFVFPVDVKATPRALLLLAMGQDRDNGQLQQQQLLEWHRTLVEHEVINDNMQAYHFVVMNTPPFFVKGLIRSALAEAYEGVVAADHAGLMYVKDIQGFAKAASLTLDERPTLVLVSAQGKVLKAFKGAFDPQLLASIQAEIATQHP